MEILTKCKSYIGYLVLRGALIGGYALGDIYCDSLHYLDLYSGNWAELSPMRTRRCYLSATTLDGNLVVLGGHDGRERQKSVEMYKDGRWESLPDMHIKGVFKNCKRSLGG